MITLVGRIQTINRLIWLSLHEAKIILHCNSFKIKYHACFVVQFWKDITAVVMVTFFPFPFAQ